MGTTVQIAIVEDGSSVGGYSSWKGGRCAEECRRMDVPIVLYSAGPFSTVASGSSPDGGGSSRLVSSDAIFLVIFKTTH